MAPSTCDRSCCLMVSPSVLAIVQFSLVQLSVVWGAYQFGLATLALDSSFVSNEL